MDRLHTHLTFGLRPAGECAACDQHRRDWLHVRRARKLASVGSRAH